ncbi:MAG: HU family DNA-binding protein [Ignavibacteria bacterium]|jgi:nucleoid DNA-binding protein
MNKQSLINKVYIKSPFGKEKSVEIFNRAIELLRESIKENKRVKVKGFGKFVIERREMKALIDHNKKAEILLPPKDKVSFKPSKKLIKRLNNKE